MTLAGAALLSAWEAGEPHRGNRRALAVLAVAHPAVDHADRSLGARDAALLQLYAGLAGPELGVIADCAGCGLVIEATLDVAALTRGYHGAPNEWRDIDLGDTVVRARPPSPADLAAAAGPHDPATIRAVLVRRCVDAPRPLTEAEISLVASVLEHADPLADVRLDLRCAECADVTRVLLDVPALVWVRLRAEARRLLLDVAALATRYGWSETDILAMSANRRRSYLELA